MRVLPVLEARRDALEKCVFCPKLCRSACPVSNAEPRETITPWGKMSEAWMAAHGDVAADPPHAAPAWACTGCHACRFWCDHRNPVADVLLDARAALTEHGVAPAGTKRVIDGFAIHESATADATRRLAHHPRVDDAAPDALLVGCTYALRATAEAREAIDATATLLSGPVALVRRCCGLPLLLAGDRGGFVRHAEHFARSVGDKGRIVVVDPGCAVALKRYYGPPSNDVAARTTLLVELAAERMSRLAPRQSDGAVPVRWHDPCQLGRALRIYEAPRAVLARVLGRAPDELEDNRDQAICSGAGGLVPSTMPEAAREMANARLAAHERAGGGRIVTACASSLLLLRKAARGTGIAVDDLVTWVARAADAS